MFAILRWSAALVLVGFVAGAARPVTSGSTAAHPQSGSGLGAIEVEIDPEGSPLDAALHEELARRASTQEGGYLIDTLKDTLIDTGAERPVRTPVAGTDSPSETNRLAVDAYRAGDLESARTHWTELLPAVEGAEKARILYDLGNVAFRSKRPLEAVGWYTAALRLSPRDEDAWTNLEHARREAGLEPADRGDLVATLRRVLLALTRTESELLAAGAALAWALLLAAEALRGGRLWRRLAFAGGAGVALLFLPYLAHLATETPDPVLTIAPKERPIEVHSEPRTEAAAIAQVGPGVELERTDELPGWAKVELEDGTQGWVEAAQVFALRR